MVGPCGRILPQWLRAPCNGVSKTDIVVGKVQCVCLCARSTQYADGRTLELSLIDHFAYRYISRKYRDLSICIDLFKTILKMFKMQLLY